jgi:two-component system sensor histidine kinase NreB
VSAILPLKPSALSLLTEVARILQPHFPRLAADWRRKMAEEFAFDERVLGVLERLNLISACKFLCQDNFESYCENLRYYGTRAAKLQVDTRAVARSLEFCPELCEPYWAGLRHKKRTEARAALEMLSSAAFVAISGSYFDTQRRESAALLAVLDAELSAADLQSLLERILCISTKTFNATLGLVLLREPDSEGMRAKATVGFDIPLDAFYVLPGQGFSGKIALTGEPAMLPDITQSNGVLNPLLRTKARSLWGVPLKKGDQVIGVLLIGFTRPYEWLPTERELLRAIADRSALAIERARMTDALREREMQVAELSGHLLKVQEQERKRISRELHDETGQALMVIRLYLGMLENAIKTRAAKQKVNETLQVVDRTIEGLRRIIARLSPLLLQELGLIAAIRKEAKDLAKSTGVKTQVDIDDSVGRLAPDVEAAIYRVVQEALHNVAKHAQAKTVKIQIVRASGELVLLVEDDGVGMSPGKRIPSERQTFGLQGMKERIGMLGGTVHIESAKGKGTRLQIKIPAARGGLETLFAQSVSAPAMSHGASASDSRAS